MKYEQSVVCPDPNCGWTASVEVEHDALLPVWRDGFWRDGVIRDALHQARLQHVIDRHVLTPAEVMTPEEVRARMLWSG